MKNNDTNCPQLTGRVIFRDQPGYAESRLVSNYYTSKDMFPEVIVYAQNTQDVQNAVLWARCKKIPVRIRSGGHNHEAFSTGTGVIVIDVSEMKDVKVDKSTKIATVQPGNNNLELYTKLNKDGLTHVGGTCSEVGISGLVLTGGMGPLLRRVGLTCDTLISFEMVDANGKVIHVTKDNEYKDLFWASCGGGGGNFGVITSLTLQTYPADTVTWFNIGWDWDQPLDKVITAWQDFFAVQDRRWFSHIDMWSKAFPKDELKKHPLKVLGVFWGAPEEAKKELAPLLAVATPKSQIIETVEWDQAIKYIEESTATFLTTKPEYKSPGAFMMQKLPPMAINTVYKALESSTSPLFNILMFTLGGATQEVPTNATAFFYRDAQFFLSYTLQWMKPEDDKKGIDEINILREQLQDYTVGNYVGNPDSNTKNYLTEYFGDNAQRLQLVKRKYDPDNIFNHPQSI